MATFYAKYPSANASSALTTTVQGEGTAGTPTGGVLTVQGDPAGTPVPISGNITASSASVGPTGSAVPLDGDYVGLNNGGTLIGAIGDSAGRQIVAGGGVAGTPAGGVVSVQGVSGGTVVPVSGTVTADQGTANATPWTVTGTGAAGTAATGVVTIQGIASMTAVKVDGSGVTGPVNVTQFGGNNVATGTGTGGNGIPRVTVSSDSALASVTTVSTVTAVTAITNALPAGTNAIGSVVPSATAAAVWQAEGAIAFGSITNVYQTVLTPSASTKIVFMRNNCNTAMTVSMDGGSTANFVLDAGDQVAVDYVANGLLSGTAAIQVKYVSAPASGSFRVNACH